MDQNQWFLKGIYTVTLTREEFEKLLWEAFEKGRLEGSQQKEVYVWEDIYLDIFDDYDYGDLTRVKERVRAYLKGRKNE